MENVGLTNMGHVINMGHEAVLLRICFQHFTNVLNIVSVTFSVLLIIDVALSLSQCLI